MVSSLGCDFFVVGCLRVSGGFAGLGVCVLVVLCLPVLLFGY